MTKLPAALSAQSPARRRELQAALSRPGAFVFLHSATGDAAVFARDRASGQGGTALPICRLSRAEIDLLSASGAIHRTGEGRLGVRYLPCGAAPRRMAGREGAQCATGRTAADRRKAKFLQAERYFKSPDDAKPQAITVNLGESPLGWLSRRKDAQGRPFLPEASVAAGERLRMDFERAQLGPSVTQDWRRFLTAGATASAVPGAVREVDGGAEAARKRVMAALDELGPDLGDAVFRTCCFLEGLESVERALNWSARSGKIVLRIALHRLADYYARLDRPKHAENQIEERESAA